MAFSNIIKLNSIVANGFLMNDIISLFKKSNYDLNKPEEISLLEEALDYIGIIKKGKTFMSDQKPIEKLEESLEVYCTTLKALKETGIKLTLVRFNEIINLSKKEIEETLNKKEIVASNLETANYLFNSIRTNLLKEANKISRKERSLFNPI